MPDDYSLFRASAVAQRCMRWPVSSRASMGSSYDIFADGHYAMEDYGFCPIGEGARS